MKKILLVLIGLIPLPLGYLMNHLMMTVYYHKALPAFMIGVVFLVAWFGLGYLTYNLAKSNKEAIMLAHSIAFVFLVLAVIQEVFLRRYLPNHIGISTQFYFMPLLNIASKFLRFFTFRMYQGFIVAFALMCSTFYLGRKVRKKRVNEF